MTDSNHTASDISDALTRWPVAIAATATFSALMCLLNPGGTVLMSMEGMLVNGGRAMLDGDNWWVPRVYGDVYTYKPALGYWLSSLPQALFSSPGETLLRLPFAGSGVVLALGLLFLFGRLLGPRTGAFIAMAATGGVLFVDKIRIAEFDGPITAFTGLAIAAATAALATSPGVDDASPGRASSAAEANPNESEPARDVFASVAAQAGLWIAAYVFLLLGFLAKGMPALMVFAPGLLLAAVLTQNLRRLFRWDHLLGGLVFAIGAAAYLWAAVAADGTAVFDQPAGEGARRSAGWTLSAFGITLAKPLLIFAAFLPWTLTLFTLPGAYSELSTLARRTLRAALGFFIGSTLTFSLVPTHEMRYYLPIAAAAAIASGVLAEFLVTRRERPRVILIGARVLQVLFLLAALVSAHDRGLLTIGLAVLLVLTAMIAWAPHVRRSVSGQLIACSLLLAVACAFVVMPGRAVRRDTTAVARVFDALLPADATVWMVAPSDHAGKHATLLHYLGREVRILPKERTPEKPEAEIRYVIYTDQRAHLLAKTHRVEDITVVEHPFYDYHLARVLGRAKAGGESE